MVERGDQIGNVTIPLRRVNQRGRTDEHGTTGLSLGRWGAISKGTEAPTQHYARWVRQTPISMMPSINAYTQWNGDYQGL